MLGPTSLLRPVGHWVPAGLAVALVLSGPLRTLDAQVVVPVHQEPRHRLVLERGPVKLLDVQILPGDTTFYHTHDSPILYVTLSSAATDVQDLGGEFRGVQPDPEPAAGATTASTARAGSVNANTGYAEEPTTHRVANVGSALFRVFAIANRGPGTESAASESSPPGTELLENRWYRAWRVELEPRGATEWHRPAEPVVAVQATDGEVEVVGRCAGEAADDSCSEQTLRVMTQPGEWFYADAEVEYAIRNRGPTPILVTVVSVK